MAKKAKQNKPSVKADVENYVHEEAKRKNIPTAENQKLVADEDKTVKKLRWKRNADLDPQLVWRGKDFDPDPLEVDAPPIYIQEKIQPRAIIEDLRKHSRERAKDDTTAQFDFFHDFNGLPQGWKEDATASYYHDEGNWQNRMILGDSLLVMASLAQREDLRGKVQCVYFDPPYGIRFNSNWQPSTKSRDVKDGKDDGTSREPEVIRAFRDTWQNGIHSYLPYLRDRLIAARELLSETGSIFLQIGDENLHLARSLMDEVFGRLNAVATITVVKTSAQEDLLLPNVCDYVLWYCRDIERVKYRQLWVDKSGDPGAAEYNRVDDDCVRRRLTPEEEARRELLPPHMRTYRQDNIVSQRPPGNFPVVFEGQEYRPLTGYWKTGESGFARLKKAARIERRGRMLSYVRFFEDFPVRPIVNYWPDVRFSSRSEEKLYVVQTAAAVVQRCIVMSTDPGDLVLDPTCGSGTAAYVAEQWGRRWITIDTSRVALTLARYRLMGARFDYYLLKDSKDGAVKEGEITGRPPVQESFTNNIRHGFVYERAPHVTLKSIANNSEIDVIWDRWQTKMESLRERLNRALKLSWEEWQIPYEGDEKWSETTRKIHEQWWVARRSRQKEVDESIARNADVEYLFDRPYKERGLVRVAGPFTVESLSPHRVLPMDEDPFLEDLLFADNDELPDSLVLARKGKRSADANVSGDKDVSGAVITDFAQVVFENLRTAGVQNTKKNERLVFENLRPFASRTGMIQFQGEYTEKGSRKRAAVSIGPEYDTVGYDLVRRAAREAVDLFDMLIVCGFAFAPEVDDTRLNFGGLTVLKARMNQDLRMADKLKATGAGNLFVVFGEPDIEIKELPGDKLQVEIRGMDIFDPTTGDVRSSGGKELLNDIAAWFVDHDYDEESFFVRQAYFVGNDPYAGLKRALKAEINETVWAELNSTVSRPFPRPTSGRICVKVINHFGDEVQKVFAVQSQGGR